MKYFIYVSLLGLLSSSIFLSSDNYKKEEQNNSKIVLQLDDYICSEGQWVYLHGCKSWISGNEVAIFDSAYIEKGQHSVELQAYLPMAESLFVLFSKNGPCQLEVGMEPDSCVIMNIEEEDGENYCSKKALQGDLNNFMHKAIEGKKLYRDKLKEFTSKGEQDSIVKLQKDRFNSLSSLIRTYKHPCAVYNLCIYLRTDFPQEGKKMFDEAAERFPQYVSLQESAKKKEPLPGTSYAQKANERIQYMMDEKYQIPLLDTSIGENISLSFPDNKGYKVSPTSDNSKYVFIDFWASWCKPCRKEIPIIKQVAKQYKKELYIYAVSIDTDHQAWQNAIKEDSTFSFQHVIGTFPNGKKTKLLSRLNIKAIPANFLIDKDQRIVAKNLRGERLAQVLDSLIQK